MDIYKTTVRGEHIFFSFNFPTTLKSGMGTHRKDGASEGVESRIDENSRLRNVKQFKDVLKGFLVKEANARGRRRPEEWIEIVYCDGKLMQILTLAENDHFM